jgi:hypothetical protein
MLLSAQQSWLTSINCDGDMTSCRAPSIPIVVSRWCASGLWLVATQPLNAFIKDAKGHNLVSFLGESLG